MAVVWLQAWGPVLAREHLEFPREHPDSHGPATLVLWAQLAIFTVGGVMGTLHLFATSMTFFKLSQTITLPRVGKGRDSKGGVG